MKVILGIQYSKIHTFSFSNTMNKISFYEKCFNFIKAHWTKVRVHPIFYVYLLQTSNIGRGRAIITPFKVCMGAKWTLLCYQIILHFEIDAIVYGSRTRYSLSVHQGVVKISKWQFLCMAIYFLDVLGGVPYGFFFKLLLFCCVELDFKI